jgi:hypothetical protein
VTRRSVAVGTKFQFTKRWNLRIVLKTAVFRPIEFSRAQVQLPSVPPELGAGARERRVRGGRCTGHSAENRRRNSPAAPERMNCLRLHWSLTAVRSPAAASAPLRRRRHRGKRWGLRRASLRSRAYAGLIGSPSFSRISRPGSVLSLLFISPRIIGRSSTSGLSSLPGDWSHWPVRCRAAL